MENSPRFTHFLNDSLCRTVAVHTPTNLRSLWWQRVGELQCRRATSAFQHKRVRVEFCESQLSCLTKCDCQNYLGGFHCVHKYWCITGTASTAGDTVPSVPCRTDAQAAVRVQVFDVRNEESCLGVWAGAGTDGGRVWWSDYSPRCSPVCPGMNAPLHPP